MLLTLDIPPGVRNVGTDLESAGRWLDGSLVRWVGGTAQSVGGWVEAPGGPVVTGTVRDAILTNVPGTSLAAAVMRGGQDIFGWTTTLATTEITPSGVNEFDWSFDMFGSVLLGAAYDDGIYEWDFTASAMTAVTNAPPAQSVVVTDERFVFALGADGDGKKIAWSDQEDRTTWTAAATNQAGDFILNSDGDIQCGRNIPGGVLILTTEDAHLATYQGPPFVYGFDRVATDCGVVSRNAVAVADSGVYWMGDKNFYVYRSGVVEVLPCDVWDEVFAVGASFDLSIAWGMHNPDFNEVWFFYTDTDNEECNRYVAFNYVEGHWTVGALDRSFGAKTPAYTTPAMFGPDLVTGATSVLYLHEQAARTYPATGGEQKSFLESGPVSLGDGEQVMSATKLIPDERTLGDVSVIFKTRFHPNDTERFYGPYSPANPTSVRFTGRQMRLRIEGDAETDWRWGVWRLEVQPRGTR